MDFVIITTARTGSNFLCSQFATDPRVAMHLELFHIDQPFFAPSFVEPAKRAGLDIASRDADPAGFMQKVKGLSPDRIVGCKIFVGQNGEAFEYVAAQPNIKKIVLYRSNILAKYISEAVSRRTGVFFRTKTEGVADQPKITFNADDFERFFNEDVAGYRYISKAINDAGQSYYLMEYDMLNNQYIIGNALVYIGALSPDFSRINTTEHLKMAQGSVYSRFSNPEEVRKYLSDRGLDYWSYDAPSRPAWLGIG